MSVEPQPEPQTDAAAPRGASIVPTEQHLSLIDIWRVLLKRRYTVLIVTALCLAGAANYAFRTQPVYQSMARIEIESSNASNMLLQNLQSAVSGGGDEQDLEYLQTQIQILQSDSVLFQTAQKLNLLSMLRAAAEKNDPAHAPVASGKMTAPERLDMIDFIRGGLTIAVVTDTNVVEVRYQNTDPRLAAEVVNQLVDTYSNEVLRLKYDRTVQVGNWLQTQLSGLKQQAADAQRHLADYQRAHNIVGEDQNSNLTTQNLQQISAALISAEADRMVKEARMREFDSMSPDLKALASDNPALVSLVDQLSSLKTQRAQLDARFGKNYPQMRQLDMEIENVQAQINNQVKLARLQIQAEYKGALGAQEALQRRLEAEEEDAYRLNENVAEFVILENQVQLSRDLYNALQMTLGEASITAGLSAANITVIDSAQVPFVPVAPKKEMALVVGLLGGFLCGCVLAFLIESIDDRLQTSEEAENVSSLPSLAAVPRIRAEAIKRKGEGKKADSEPIQVRHWLVALKDPQSHGAEAYRGLRSSLLLSSIDHPPQVILVTSALPGEGKTTTAVNLAVTFAQRGERVLLVDADLRRGTLHRLSPLSNPSLGLSNVLTQPQVQRELAAPLPELPTLHVIATGPRPPNPAEMLASNRMEEQLRQWTQEFDRLVVDTAPMLAVSDTAALAVFADAVVLVARAGVTRKRALIRARDLLWRINAPIAGVVVNDVDLRLEHFYTYRYSMYGYKYGYGERQNSPYSDRAYGYEDKDKGE